MSIRRKYNGECTYRLHTICHEPVETLDEEKEAEHQHEGNVEFVSEDSEGEERFGHEHPRLVVQTLPKQN